MSECYAQGMEVQASWNAVCVRYRISSIQKVADDRAAESEGVCRMDSELMGAACCGVKQYVHGSVRVFRDNFILCQSGFSLLEIHFLARPFVIVSC